MATVSVLSLVNRVRDILGNWGDARTLLAAALTATATSVSVDEVKVAKAGDLLQVDYETMEVTDSDDSSTPEVFTVRRGQRGTTAVNHNDDSVVYVNPKISNQRILDAINAALAASYPRIFKLVVDETLTVVEDQYEYSVPSTLGEYVLDELWRVEMENSDEGGEYYMIRTWDKCSTNALRLYGDYDAGRHIKLVGTKRFSALRAGGNLDSSFPTNSSATDYLVYAAAGRILTERQAQVGLLDSFQGITDTFAASQPFMPLQTAKALKQDAERELEHARMTPPEHYTPLATRRYFART
jgi:hypothetical protein